MLRIDVRSDAVTEVEYVLGVRAETLEYQCHLLA